MRTRRITSIAVVAVVIIGAVAIVRADQPQTSLSPDRILKGTTPTITITLDKSIPDQKEIKSVRIGGQVVAVQEPSAEGKVSVPLPKLDIVGRADVEVIGKDDKPVTVGQLNYVESAESPPISAVGSTKELVLLLVYVGLIVLLPLICTIYDIRKSYKERADVLLKLQDKPTIEELRALLVDMDQGPTGLVGLTRGIVAVTLILLLAFAVFHLVVFAPPKIPDIAEKLLMLLAGTLTAITGFYFGSKAATAGATEKPQSAGKDAAPTAGTTAKPQSAGKDAAPTAGTTEKPQGAGKDAAPTAGTTEKPQGTGKDAAPTAGTAEKLRGAGKDAAPVVAAVDDDDDNNDDEDNNEDNDEDNNNDDDNNNNDEDNDEDNNNDDDNNSDEEGANVRRAPPTTETAGPRAAGRLTIVGTGITAVSQMTLESVAHIRNADVVFYHATNGITATHIRKLNPNAIDLYEYYGEGKARRATYVEMAELMLRQVRLAANVVGVFHGHPGYFVSPARRALAIARMEGYETQLLSAVSSTDCLFSDLRVDPGVFGCQVIMASRVFQEGAIVATSGHVVLLQVGAVGDRGFSFTGYKNATIGVLMMRLIDIYGEEQESVYYFAPLFPTCKPTMTLRKLSLYREPSILRSVSSGILYLPPKGFTLAAMQSAQTFADGLPYGKFESNVVASLDRHKTPKEFYSRQASDALFRAMSDLVMDPSARELFRRSANEFVDKCDGLTSKERLALLTGDMGALRAVTTNR